MAKDANVLMNELGVTSTTDADTLINKLGSLEIINQTELLGVKSVSVTTLPTVVKNSEADLKSKMINIVTDEDKGSAYLINKRTVLIKKILSNINERLKQNETDMPLIAETILEFAGKDYNTLLEAYKSGAERVDSFPIEWFNKKPEINDRFFGIGITKDKRNIGFCAEVVAIEDNWAIFKFIDFALLGEDYPILNRTMAFNGVTVEEFTAMENGKYTFKGYDGHHSIGVELFSIPPRINNNFFGTTLLRENKDDAFPSVATFTAKVTGITNNKVDYDLVDTTIFHNGEYDKKINYLVSAMPLVVDEVLMLPVEHTSIRDGYKNSIDLASLNKIPEKDEQFWGLCKTTDNYIYSFVARCTGEFTISGSVKFAQFEFIETQMIYDGSINEKVANLENNKADLKYVNEEIQRIVNIAEGKTETYIVTATTSSIFLTEDDDIEVNDPFISLTDEVDSHRVLVKDLNLGDMFLVKSLNYPDRWVSNINPLTLSILETRKVDLGEIKDYIDAQDEAINQAIENKSDKKDLNSLTERVVVLEGKESNIEGYYNLGTIDEDPSSATNSTLNYVVAAGLCLFRYTNGFGYTNTYMMIITNTSSGVTQTIFNRHTPDSGYYSFITRTKALFGSTWTVSNFELVDRSYVAKSIANLVGEAPETLNTISELAKALQDNNSVIEALDSAITNKADKDEIPTKLSQLEQDIELGVSEENVMEIVEDNSELTEELEVKEVKTLNIGTSTSYDETSDSEVPTTKAVKTMLGTAKLVARGTLDNNPSQYAMFNLDKTLEENKLYLVKIHTETDYDFVTIGIFNFTAPYSPIICRDMADNIYINCSCSFGPNFLIIEEINKVDENYNLIFDEYSTAEVYELPFTLGGGNYE